MKIFGLAFLTLIALIPTSSWAGDYSDAEKSQIYYQSEMQRPSNSVLSIKDPRWQALNGSLLVDKINQIGNDRATVLAASGIEFNYLLQPLSDIKILEERRCIINNLNDVFLELDPLLRELAQLEHVFTHLLDQEKKPPTQSRLLQLFFEGSVVTAATTLSIPYIANHLLFDWHSIMTTQRNVLWLCVMVCMKIAGTASGFYKGIEFVAGNVQQMRAKMSNDDRFVVDFSKAMRLVQKIIVIIVKNPTLANTLTIFIGFDHSRKLVPGLKETLLRAEKRLQAEKSALLSCWAAKNSSSLCDEIKTYTQNFKMLYYGLARLDANLAVVRIYRHRREKGMPVTFAQFDVKATKPCFAFKDLENPLIDNSVANDFELDGNAVLNGPSTCGKTGAMKSISSAFIMAQSILLVHANKAELALFEDIGTHFNVQDNIREGLSSFAAQRLAIKNLLELAKNQKKTLLLIDEPYNGVTSELAETLTVELIEELIALPHVAFLLATHHKKPVSYGAKEDSVVRNWQPEVIEHDGKFRRTFKIKSGIAEWWYNSEMALRFVKQLNDE